MDYFFKQYVVPVLVVCLLLGLMEFLKSRVRESRWNALYRQAHEMVQAQNFTYAQPLVERTYLQAVEKFSEDSPEVTKTLNLLLDVYEAEKNYQRLEPLLKKQLMTLEKKGRPLAERTRILQRMARMKENTGELNDAEKLTKKVLESWFKVGGESDPRFAETLEYLLHLGTRLKRPIEERISHLYRLLKVKKSTYGAQHLSVLKIQERIANLYLGEEKYGDALHITRDTLAVQESRLRANHPKVALLKANLARCLIALDGDFKEAETLLKDALSIQEEAYGPDHPQTGKVVQLLADLYYQRGFYAKAESFYKWSLDIWKNHSQDHSTELARCYRNLGRLNEAKKNFDQAGHH